MPGAPLGEAGPGAEPQSRGCQPGAGSVPGAQGFRSQMSQQPREGGKGTQKGRCLAPLSPKPQWPVRPRLLGRDRPAGQQGARPADLPLRSPARRLADGTDPRLPVTPGRLRLHFASSLGVELTSKNEFEENRRRSRRARCPAPIGRPWKLWFLGSCSQKACPPPAPSPPTSRGVGQSLWQAIKWLSARRAPSPEVSSPTGTGRSLDTQHVGTAYEEDAAP